MGHLHKESKILGILRLFLHRL